MRPLLLSGFGTSLRVNGRTLEVDWRPEGRKESYRPPQLPFDSITGSVSCEALRFLAIHARVRQIDGLSLGDFVNVGTPSS